MSTYPYDKSDNGFCGSTEALRACFKLSFALMDLYMPFGQSDSSYCDTGYPEYVALGIRTFLSTPENVVMMRDLGKTSLDNLTSLAASDHAQKGLDMTKRTKDMIQELKKIDKRTYDALMGGIKKIQKKKFIQKIQNKRRRKKS